MPTDRLVLVGAGGHGKVVLDAYRVLHPGAVVEVRDDDGAKQGMAFLGLSVVTPISPSERYRSRCHVSIGDNPTRRRIAQALVAADSTLVSIVHPRAVVAAAALVADGVFVAAGAVIAPDARLGTGAIVNHLAVVDHDCVVGDWCHIAPGAVLGGEVTLG